MTDESTAQFLACLWQLQAAAGLSNAALARQLTCDPSYIRHLKAGRKRKPGLRIVMLAAQRFPELRSFLLPDELLVSNTDVPSSTIDEEQR